jgi:CTP:molybdopterin cytidylyltransferase MocA
MVSEFMALADDQPAHSVVRHDPARVYEVAVEDEAVTMKLNTPAEYQAALIAYRAERPSRVG